MKISVIVPVYGVEKYIEKCIKSVLEQELEGIEILIINDGTKDESIKVVEKKFSDRRIKIISKENGGLSSARNTGLEIAKGKYVYFLDGDDWIEKQTLKLLYENSEDADIICSGFYFYNEETQKRKGSKFKFPYNIHKIKEGKYYLCNGEEINVWNKLYKTEFIKRFNFKFIEGIIYEDQDFGFKTLLLAKKVKYIPNHLYNYRINREGSIMNSLKKEKELVAIKKIKKELNNFFLYKQLDTLQSSRLKLKLLNLEIWEKEILGTDNLISIKNIEEKIKEIYIENKKDIIGRKIIRLDIKEILKRKSMKKVDLFDIFYWKTGLISLKTLKNRWK